MLLALGRGGIMGSASWTSGHEEPDFPEKPPSQLPLLWEHRGYCQLLQRLLTTGQAIQLLSSYQEGYRGFSRNQGPARSAHFPAAFHFSRTSTQNFTPLPKSILKVTSPLKMIPGT